jgi:hypothetical protein
MIEKTVIEIALAILSAIICVLLAILLYKWHQKNEKFIREIKEKINRLDDLAKTMTPEERDRVSEQLPEIMLKFSQDVKSLISRKHLWNLCNWRKIKK